MRILVTGGAGYIGSHLEESIAAAWVWHQSHPDGYDDAG